CCYFSFCTGTLTSVLYTLSLHDALPIFDTFEKPLPLGDSRATMRAGVLCGVERVEVRDVPAPASGPHEVIVRVSAVGLCGTDAQDRKSTRLNSSHVSISYAVFCLKKKKK